MKATVSQSKALSDGRTVPYPPTVRERLISALKPLEVPESLTFPLACVAAVVFGAVCGGGWY